MTNSNADVLERQAEAACERALGIVDAPGRQRAHRRAARARWREHGERLRHLPHGAGHAGDLRQDRRAQGALPQPARSTITRRSGTPNGCSRSSSATCSTWHRRWSYSAIHRKESRGSHQRLDGFEQRDDVNFLKHSLAQLCGRRCAAHQLQRRQDHEVQARHARLWRRGRKSRSCNASSQEAAHG